MGEEPKGLENIESEQTTRWVEHQQFQRSLMRWKIGIAAVVIAGILVALALWQ